MAEYQNLPIVDGAEGLSDPTLAFNPNAQTAFLDIAKDMRPWIGHTQTKWMAMTYEELRDGAFLDAQGWPTSIPEDLASIGTIWTWDADEPIAAERAGVYVLEYEGEGLINLRDDADILSEEPGRIVFRNDGGKFQLNIKETDPDGTGDYIRNISIVREDFVELHEAGAVFRPDWIETLTDVHQLRFMDWIRTNDSDIVDWDDRPKLDDASWRENGFPVELMVRLANETGADAWFAMPHSANEDYVREFATYVRDHLDPRLTATVEFSNEIWNYGFDQTNDLRLEAKAAWGIAGDDWTAVMHYQAKRAVETALIWDEVFGDEADARLINVLATQTSNPGRTKQLLDPTTWFEKEPDAAVSPADVFDAIAVTTYFGSKTAANAAMRDELIAAIEDPQIDAADWYAAKLMDPDYNGSIPQLAELLAAQKTIASDHGLVMLAYEGGQHVHHLAFIKDGGVVLDTFMREFVRSDQMAELYKALWDVWEEYGDGPFMQFGHVRAASKWGSWGLLESMADSTPRHDMLELLNNETPAWWDGGDASAAYMDGVTVVGGQTDDLLLGTTEEDYLIGAAGDDVLIGGKGDDGINGGDGNDTLRLSGAPADYTLTAEGRGYRIDGPDGSDFVIGVENFLFDEEEVLDLIGFVAAIDAAQAAQSSKPMAPLGGVTFISKKEANPVAGDDGDNRLSATEETDLINGGAGVNTAVFTGLAGDYQTVADGEGYWVTNATRSDFVIGIERFAFGDGTELDLASFLELSAAPEVIGLADLAIVDGDGVSGAALNGGINIHSLHAQSMLGKELLGDAQDADSVYLVSSKGFTAEIDGVSVKANYWSTQNNRAVKGGETLAETALDAASALSTVVIGAAGIHGSNYGDTFQGRLGNDRFFGEGGGDTLYGNGGDDVIDGGEGDDFLGGGVGDDVLIGGTGDDNVGGSAGADIFVFAQGDGVDQVRDFSAEDRLNLSGHDLGGQTLDQFARLDETGRLTLDFGDDVIAFNGLDLGDVVWMDVIL